MDDAAHTRSLPTPAQVQAARDALRRALTGLRSQVTMERDGLVLIALEPAAINQSASAVPPPYLLFEQAVTDGSVEVHEIGTGTVPSVAASTKDHPVVIFAGDTITGGKQNRVINISVWLPAGKVTELPVTCLELGRWDPGLAARFGAGRKADYALRSMMSYQVGEQRRRVLQRQVARPRLNRRDRVLLATASRAMTKTSCSSFIVRPETLLRWHRELVKKKWTYRRTGQLGRPQVDADVREAQDALRPVLQRALDAARAPGRCHRTS